MIAQYLKVIILSFMCVISFITKSDAQDLDERRIKVALRMIGHELLLNSGDSVSRVLAIEKEADGYKIQFEADFQFTPDVLVSTISEVVKKSGIAVSYLVEIDKCETETVVYSYEIRNSDQIDLIPCKMRMQPRACYTLFITILDTEHPMIASLPGITPRELTAMLILTLLIVVVLSVYFWKRRNVPKSNADIIALGQYQFDIRDMSLSYKDEKTELSSKEADLLFLLYSSENKTLKRERILKIVWGNENEYIGRTLDVFVSKLRKKLIADSSLKIVNIRGIGYKFVINNQN